MTTANENELAPILADLRTVTAEAQAEFGAFDAAQLNWKPAPKSWSIGQCFEHLITVNSLYFPELEAIIAGKRKNSTWQSISPFTGFLGRWLIRSLDPKSVKRLPAPKASQPSSSEVDPAIIRRFVDNQARVAELVAATERVDLRRTVVSSPFLSLMTYTLVDGFKIVAVHERRHLGQARRVTQAPGFPAADD
jgi:hypothetical protein